MKNLTALKIALPPSPLPPQSLVIAAIGRHGDSVSLNPQPLPPKDSFAKVNAGSNAPLLFLTANIRSNPAAFAGYTLAPTAGKFPVDTLEVFHKTADVTERKSATADAFLAAAKELKQVDQLEQAEKLMEDAYRRVSNPDHTDVDVLRAHEEEGEAERIRQAVVPGLSQNQQAALWSIDDTEIGAIGNAASGVDDTRYASAHQGQWGVEGYSQRAAEEFETAAKQSHLGAQENQQLIDWILSK